MKKITLFISAVLLAAASYAANDAVISAIKNTNATYKNIVCDFDQAKNMKIVKEPVLSAGKLYYEGEKMSMIYSKPEGEYFKITESTLSMLTGKTKLNKKLKAGDPFMMLRNLLIFSMKGDINGLAEMANSDVAYTSTATQDQFVFTSKSKISKGYNKIVLYYNKTSHVLEYMELHQPTGTYTTYTLKNIKTGGVIPADAF